MLWEVRKKSVERGAMKQQQEEEEEAEASRWGGGGRGCP